MMLTLRSITTHVDPLQGQEGLDVICTAAAQGALMGARGNSGVILAQIMRGICSTIREAHEAGTLIDAEVVSQALTAASDGAYQAVGDPVEGTIITVMREAATAAADLVASTPSAELAGVFSAAGDAADAAVARTPEQLDVLAQAGVVDAGASGLALFFDAAREVLTGRPVPEPEYQPPPAGVVSKTPADAPAQTQSSIADLRYEVMYFLDTDDDNIADFKKAWAEIGDSIAVVGGDGTFNCHIHTDHIGESIEAGIAIGRPYQIRVTDLLEEAAEHAESAFVTAELGITTPPTTTPATFAPVDVTEPDTCAVVAIAAGAGVIELLESQGARVVEGGQSMNPSVADLLEAINSVPAGNVVILPNNKNIIAVAEQAAKASTVRSVAVVPTTNVVQAIALLVNFNPANNAEVNATTLTSGFGTTGFGTTGFGTTGFGTTGFGTTGLGNVTYGEVTHAVRGSDTPAGPAKVGDWLGISAAGIEIVASSPLEATTKLLQTLITDDHELLTLIAGEGADETEQITEWLKSEHPELEVEPHQGGQPHYRYFLGLE